MTTPTPASIPVTVTLAETRPRPTPPPAGRRFRDALAGVGSSVLDGVEAASPLLPGGGVVAAAVRGARGGATSPVEAGGAPEGPGVGGAGSDPSLQEFLGSAADQNLRYLALQEQISAENRRYTALSNVLKARHETAKAAVNNIR